MGVLMCICRLPIVQGSAICFLVPAIALFAQDETQCYQAIAASRVKAALGGVFHSTAGLAKSTFYCIYSYPTSVRVCV